VNFFIILVAAPDLDGGGPGVVEGSMYGYRIFRWGMADDVSSISTDH